MGSMYSLCTVPSICSIDDRSWSWCACVGGLRPLLWPLLSVLGAYVGIPGPLLGAVLGLILAILGRSWGLCWRPWDLLGPMLAFLGRCWGLCWRSWCSWGLCLRSWVALGAYVGFPGLLLGSVLTVLGRSWGLLVLLGDSVASPGGSGRAGKGQQGRQGTERNPWPERSRGRLIVKQLFFRVVFNEPIFSLATLMASSLLFNFSFHLHKEHSKTNGFFS